MGKGRLKERCGLESQTNFFPFKKSPKTECGLDARIYGNTRFVINGCVEAWSGGFDLSILTARGSFLVIFW